MTDTDNLELKKRSRRRLVGAAALTLAAAVILPMVMDQEPQRIAQDIQVVIPDRDADGALARPSANHAGTPADNDITPPPEDEPPAPSVPATPALNVAPDAAEPPRAAVPEAGGPPPPAKPQPVPAAPAKPAAREDEAARVRALLGGAQSDAAKAVREETLVVQVGAFGEPATAAALVRELKGKGFPAYTEKAGAVTRVRVGPFASRAEAEKAAERLLAAGRKAVVTPR